LTITAKGTVPGATAPIANAYAKTLLTTEADDPFVSLSVLDRATVPTSPSSPVKGPILVGAFVLGLIVALLAALFTGALARRRRRADELRSQLGASVLAEVPAAPARVRATDRLWATLTPAEAPGLVEALQQLRANFELTLPHTGDSFVVAITSPGDGDGKSTIAANLAWLLASVGHDVALIDADLRRPALGRMFRQTTGPGLSAGAHTDVSMLLQPTHMSTLSFIPSGVPDRHPAEVIATALPKVLQGLRSRHGIIIVDAPPLGTVAETATIASITGAAILVIDTRQRDPEEIEHAVLELQDRGARLFGIVLNRVRGTRPTSPYALGTSGDRQSRKAITTNGQGTSPSDARAFEPGPH
jgi:capsular exopolysaccharide synthesis family protein